jgi:putative pyoverdin transport system ATP-binding/permease protein
MKLYNSFNEQAPNKVFLSIVLGALAGIAYAFLIPIVLNSLSPEHGRLKEIADLEVRYVFGFEVATPKLAAVFLALCCFILVARSFSQITLLRVSMDVAVALRMKIYRRIASAPIVGIERVGASRLIAVLTNDVWRIVAGARVLPDLLISAVTLVGMLGFLLYMNSNVFWFVIGAMAFGVVSYQVPVYFGNKDFVRARDASDDLHQAIHGLIYGAKELKLNHEKQELYLKEVLSEIEAAGSKYDKRGSTIVRAAMNYGELISFFVIGAIAFIFINYHAITNSELIGVIMALLYVTSPVATILNSIPEIVIAQVSYNKVEKIFAELPVEENSATQGRLPEWSTVHFSGVSFQHQLPTGPGFKVGPVDFEVQRGQITFIVGGNGSGKSTLSKLLTLHYVPTEGEISFGSTVVTPATLFSCRQEIGAIFTDYYLFDRLLDPLSEERQAQIDAYLVALELDAKVSVVNGRFSTLALSDGQRKRLALLVSLLEDRSFYLFDEWAADQDPEFKAVFYEMILPDLRARNNVIIIISHDERYFHLADQILVMENGKLLRTERSERMRA